MTKKIWLNIFAAGVLILVIGSGFLVKLNIEREKAEILEKFPDRGVPRINIVLNNITAEEIYNNGKDKKYGGNELELYISDEGYQYNGIEIKTRGNSTIEHPKKPYQIRFRTKTNLLNLGPAKKWVLLANYLDNSQVRNDIALNIAEMLGVEYASKGDFVEFYINGEYQGIYYLVKKIEIGKNSVYLQDPEGVLLELDTLHKDEEVCYMSYLGDCLVLKDAVSWKDDVNEAATNFLDDFNKLEIAAEKGDYDIVSRIIDVESFAKYFLVNEFTVNPDAYSSSFYLYRDGKKDKIHAGPVWDFDFALRNTKWVWWMDGDVFSPEKTMARKKEAFGLNGLEEDKNISKLFYYLMEIPEFREKTREIFQEKMSGKKEELVATIIETVKRIKKAVEQNNQRWEIENFDGEITILVEWIEKRYDFFEQEYGAANMGGL